MKSNLDVWAIQYFDEELYTALEQIKEGMNIIYSNCYCTFTIGDKEIKSRQFDTFLYNEESDILIMLMRGGKVTKDDIIKYLDEHDKEYSEVTFAPSIAFYDDGDNVPELWFAREEYVLVDAIRDSISKNIFNCQFYPTISSELSLNYISNNGTKEEIDGRLFNGIIVLDDKIILIINQQNNNDKNMSESQIIECINANKMSYEICTGNPDVFVNNFSRKIKK